MADDDLRKRLVDAASSLAPERVVDPVPIAKRARRSHRRRGTVRAGALVAAVLVVGAVGVDRIVGSDDDQKVETTADDFEAGGWERLPDEPLSGRVGATAVWNGEEVVVVGGSTYLCPPNADCVGPSDPPFSDGAAYDPSTREWRSIAPSPAAFYGEGAAVVAGDLYFLVPCMIERFTAEDIDACPSTEGDVAFIRYDVHADEWTVLDAPPTGRDYGLEGVGRFVVAYTGSDERGESPDLIFDTESSTWQEIPDDPMPAVFDRTVVGSAEGDALILIGAPIARGSEPSQERNVVARLDLATRTWAELPPPPGRGYRGWGVDDLVALEPHFGGHGGLLDPARGTWSELPPGPDVEGWENQIAGVIGRGDAVYTDATGWLLDLSQARWIEISPPDARQTFPFSNVTAVGRDLFLFGGDRWDGGDGELLGDAWIWRAPSVDGDREETTTSGPSGPAKLPPITAPVQNRIVDVHVYETRVEVEFSDEVPDYLVARAEVPASFECSPVPMPGVDEFVNVVMRVPTENTPNGLPSDLVTMREGTGLVERAVVTCAFEGQVHMAIGLSRAASLQGYEATIEDDPPRLVVHLAASARD